MLNTQVPVKERKWEQEEKNNSSMKNLLISILGYFLVCCNTSDKKYDNHETIHSLPDSSKTGVSKIFDCSDDSLANVLLKKGKDSLLVQEFIPEPAISFSSDYSDDYSFTKYSFSYKGNKLAFIDTVFEKNRSKTNKRSIYINDLPLNVCGIKNKSFAVDSMEMHIIYTESEIYTFKNNPSYLLVVSHPMNWVGLMTRFSFFQLIDIKERKVIEFIREGDD